MCAQQQWSQSQEPTGATAPDLVLDGTSTGGCRSPGMGWRAVQKTGASLRPG